MAGIERGTPDVSIAREMDTPLHRVLLSGLVYTRARLTAGLWLNRRGEEPIRGCWPRVWVFTRMLLTPSCVLSFRSVKPPGKLLLLVQLDPRSIGDCQVSISLLCKNVQTYSADVEERKEKGKEKLCETVARLVKRNLKKENKEKDKLSIQ